MLFRIGLPHIRSTANRISPRSGILTVVETGRKTRLARQRQSRCEAKTEDTQKAYSNQLVAIA
jgi:hypothetical protein